MAKFSIHTLSESQYELWNSFLKRSHLGSPFMTSYWLKAYSSAKNIDFEILGCFDNNNQLVAGIGFCKRSRFGRYKLMINLLGIDSYVVYQPKESKLTSKKESYYFEIMNLFISHLENQFDHVEMSFSSQFSDIRPFLWKNYQQQVKYTYIGDICAPDVMIKSFNPDIRNKINKAQKLDYRIDKTNDEHELKIAYGLIDRSLKKNSQPHILGEHEFICFCKSLAELGLLVTYNIYLNETPVATRVIVKGFDMAYDFQAGGNEMFFNTGMNQLLSFQIFTDLFSEGIFKYDFRGANTPSVAKYKSGFNFSSQPYLCVSKDQGSTFKLLLEGKRILKKV